MDLKREPAACQTPGLAPTPSSSVQSVQSVVFSTFTFLKCGQSGFAMAGFYVSSWKQMYCN